MKVLMVAHTFPPFGTVGGSVRLVKHLKYFAQSKSNWEPTVVTIRDDIDLLYLGKHSSFSLEEIPAKIKIIRTKTNEFKNPQFGNKKIQHFIRLILLLLTRLFVRYLLVPDEKVLWHKHLCAAIKDEIAKEKYDVIYATAPPFSVLNIARKISKEADLPLILDIKDDWLDPERFTGIKTLRLFIEKKMEAACVSAAEKVILVTEMSQEAFQARYPDQRDKMVYIPNGCDVDEYRSYWESPPAKYKKFTLVHAGVFSSRRDLGSLFKAIKQFIDESDEIKNNFTFKIIGRIPGDQAQLIEQIGIGMVIELSGYLTREEYTETLHRSHLPIAINYDIPTLIPGKIYEYWGSRNASLLLDSDTSAAAKLVHKYELGDVVSPDDTKAILRVLQEKWKQYKAEDLPLVETEGLERFDRKHLTNQLHSLFDEVYANDPETISSK